MNAALGAALFAMAGLTACAKTDEGPEITSFGGGPSGGDVGPTPVFGTTQTQATPPPSITGGTLLVTKDGRAVASDPERDQVYVVNLRAQTVTTLPLQAGDEPGRLVEDDEGLVHVALRRGGAVASIALGPTPVSQSPTVIARRSVCPAPRGITFDATTGNLLIACVGGELVTMPAALGAGAATTVRLDQDLRDVFVVGGTTFVTRMRTAELLAVGVEGAVIERQSAPVSSLGMAPDVAWRTVLAPAAAGGGAQLVMVHQRAFTGTVSTQPGGYSQSGSGCSGASIVESTVTTFGATLGTEMAPSAIAAPALSNAVLPVDIAVAPNPNADSYAYAVVAAGNGKTAQLPGLLIINVSTFAGEAQTQNPCDQQNNTVSLPGSGPSGAAQAIAVAYTSEGNILVQTREPESLFVVTTDGISTASIIATIPLATDSHEDTGHSIFHSNSGGFIACASCHGEGREDGRVWTFDDAGPRRTQSVRGTIEGTAPYHWDGTLADLPALTAEVFVKRMSGNPLASSQITALQNWLFTIPPPASSPPLDPASAARGQALFNDSSVGCTACHNGPRLTNNATVDVGTGSPFQVPALIGVGWRAPYLHDGRASLLQDRFNPTLGGGDAHGHTSQLSASQINDLVSYLETL
jgi:mono/diheme cytochrome c family protein